MNRTALLAAITEGYYEPRELPTGDVIGVRQMVVTFGLFVGITEDGYRYRYCYELAEDALTALRTWDGIGDAPGPWIKRKGLGVDQLGPGAVKETA